MNVNTQKQFLAKYGHVKVKFSSYYKFSFVFFAVLENGNRLAVTIGGDSDVIYKLDIIANAEYSVNELCPYSGSVYQGEEMIESFYDL